MKSRSSRDPAPVVATPTRDIASLPPYATRARDRSSKSQHLSPEPAANQKQRARDRKLQRFSQTRDPLIMRCNDFARGVPRQRDFAHV
jgi:hypothetical protein